MPVSDILLQADALHRSFGGLKALSGVSLEVRRNEIHAVIGPNGAGKSTLINLLSGDMPPSSGTVHIGERDITALKPDQRARAGIGRSYQRTTLFLNASVHENVRLAAQAHGRHALRPFGHVANDRPLNDAARAALAAVGLAERAPTMARFLSHGEQRQLEIAMVLATEPDVILLDEPLAGMGQAEARQMVALIGQLKAGRGVLLVEHDMDAVFALADRLTVMADGEIIATGAPDAVRNHPAVRLAYLGEEAQIS